MAFLRRLFGRRDADAPARLPSPDALVLLMRAASEFEAAIACDQLEAAGITAMVKNLDAVSAQSGVMSQPWSQELWVLRKDVRRAREVLAITEEQG